MPTPVEEYPGITPHLIVSNAADAIRFYEKAFGARVLDRSDGPEGRVWHSELAIGRGKILVADEFPELGMVAPSTVGASPISLHMYVPDVDKASKRAMDAGAKSAMPREVFGVRLDPQEPQDKWWGDRYMMLQDPYGYRWELATRRERLSEGELKGKRQAFYAEHEDEVNPAAAKRKAQEWHQRHPQFKEPNVPPKDSR